MLLQIHILPETCELLVTAGLTDNAERQLHFRILARCRENELMDVVSCSLAVYVILVPRPAQLCKT